MPSERELSNAKILSPIDIKGNGPQESEDYYELWNKIEDLEQGYRRQSKLIKTIYEVVNENRDYLVLHGRLLADNSEMLSNNGKILNEIKELLEKLGKYSCD